MISGPATAKVLVVSDNSDDAAQVVEQLGDEYEQVRSSTDPAKAVADFEAFCPDVLLLAFSRLDKAQRYSLGLYRQSPMVATHRHATVLLVSKSEVRAAFDLCKSGNFDDYLLHWPHAQDGQRLAMSVWNAARSVALQSSRPAHGELDRHARQLVEIDSLLLQELAEGEIRLGGAARVRQATEQAFGAAIDEFAQRLTDRAHGPIVAADEGEALAREVTSLKATTFSSSAEAGAAAHASAAHAGAAEGSPRATPGADARLRCHDCGGSPFRVVVDDDALTGKLIAQALQHQNTILRSRKTARKRLSCCGACVSS